MAATTLHSTLSQTLWLDQSADKTILRKAILVIAGSLLITLAAKVQIPFYPVPLTMQTFAIMVIGMAYGWRLAAVTLLAYLAQGAAGLPVFAGTPEKGIGLAYMAGPTGGYLLGFFLAASLTGFLAERGWDRSVLGSAAAMFLGTAAIYIPGVLWLGSLIGWDKPVLELGLLPFLYGDLLKLALAAALLPMVWKIIERFKAH